MESTVRIILGILLVFSVYHIESASLTQRFRLTRNAELPSIETTSVTNITTEKPLTANSSLVNKGDLQIKDASPLDQKLKVSDDILHNNEKISSGGELPTPNEKEKNVKFEPVTAEESKTKGNYTKLEEDEEEGVEEKTKGTGRSLNIDIEKYISPEFHNKNNVYSLPTSPEIEKYLDPESQDFTEEVTKSFVPISRTTNFNYELTTPQNKFFDSKFQLLADRIKQNLDEFNSNVDHFKQDDRKNDFDEGKYDVSKLIDNYKNADNDTDVTLHANEFKNIDFKVDKNKHNRDMESGKNVNYESTFLKSQTFDDEKPEHSDVPSINNVSSESKESINISDNDNHEISTTTSKPITTLTPTKKPRIQFSLHNNTIETTAPDSEIKPKNLKHFSESSSLDPLFEVSYTKPVYENAINISKRGSTKLTISTQKPDISTASFMDYDKKNFSIPPTATAWTLVSLKEVPRSSTPSNEINHTKVGKPDTEQNSQENQLVTLQISTHKPESKIITTTATSTTENKVYTVITTDKLDTITTTGSDNLLSTTFEYPTSTEDSTEITEETSTKMFEPLEETTENTTSNSDVSTSTISEDTTSNSDVSTSTISENTTSNSDFITSTISEDTTTSISEVTESSERYEESSSEDTTTEDITTYSDQTDASSLSMSTEDDFKVPAKTESENELYTTITAPTQTSKLNKLESTTISLPATIKPNISISTDEEEADTSSEIDNDYSEVSSKKDEKNATEVNDPEIEIVPIDNTEHSTSTTHKPTTISVKITNDSRVPNAVLKDSKTILGSVEGEVENSTVEATSSTELLSHDDSNDENNSGMIAAIAISSVGGVCLIILAGLLLIMRKRQKRVTYGQRCRPVSLDAYSLDNVSVCNSVRRKGGLRASKRSYGNPAFDDPVSISHQMSFQQLAKFADNFEGISAEFEEIPQVTARASEVPPGCETKNRYANVIPLPETRVFLKPFDNEPQSDYINANYVTGPKNTRGYYIACQGPMQNTVDDFWRMIWEQQSRVVLMLTNLYENGIEKCADYLPPSEVLDCHRLFGDFQITLKKREVKEKYVISSLQLKNMVSNSWREVTHLWYLGWPERGVPTEANSLIAFLIEARSHLKAASNNNSTDDKTSESTNMHISSASSMDVGPLVIHCSPGTGRTGTAIACDISIRDFELTRAVDVPKIVYRVRRDRASAVQTREQYAFIYKVITLYATKLTGGALDSI